MKIKNVWIVMLLALCLFAAPVAAEQIMEDYSIPELDMEIELPESYGYVFTRDISQDDPAFAELGLTKEQLFASDSVYLEALTDNRNAEIIVTKLENDWSEMYYDFNELSDEDLLALADLCLASDDSDVKMEYAEYGLFDENDEVRFLKAIGTFEGEESKGITVQYVTVLNGEAYTFTFNFTDSKLSEEQESMTEAVVVSAEFTDAIPRDKTESNTFFIVIIVVLLVVIGLLLAVIRKQKYSLKDLGEEIEEEIAEENAEKHGEKQE